MILTRKSSRLSLYTGMTFEYLTHVSWRNMEPTELLHVSIKNMRKKIPVFFACFSDVFTDYIVPATLWLICSDSCTLSKAFSVIWWLPSSPKHHVNILSVAHRPSQTLLAVRLVEDFHSLFSLFPVKSGISVPSSGHSLRYDDSIESKWLVWDGLAKSHLDRLACGQVEGAWGSVH